MPNIMDQEMPSFLWTVSFDTVETKDGAWILRKLPNGYYRFSLLLRDPECKAQVLGVIEGFRVDRDWMTILPPASRGVKNEIYHFVKFTPKMLDKIMVEVENERTRFLEDSRFGNEVAALERRMYRDTELDALPPDAPEEKRREIERKWAVKSRR